MERLVVILHTREVPGVGSEAPAPVWARCPTLPHGTVPLTAPGCPRSAWVFHPPCPKRWRGPGRSFGRLQSEGKVWGGQTPLLMVLKGHGQTLLFWGKAALCRAEASPLTSRIMSSNIWLWIRPRESTLQVCRGIRVSDQSTALAPFPAGPMTCRLMVGATCGDTRPGDTQLSAQLVLGWDEQEEPSVRCGGDEGDKNSTEKPEVASHPQGRLREEDHQVFGGIRGWEKLL